jgi:hypothetical protein
VARAQAYGYGFTIEAVSLTALFYPDYTVGPGIAPDLLTLQE